MAYLALKLATCENKSKCLPLALSLVSHFNALLCPVESKTKHIMCSRCIIDVSHYDSNLRNRKAEENVFGGGEDSSEEEHRNSMCDVLGLNPCTVKERSLVVGFMCILVSH